MGSTYIQQRFRAHRLSHTLSSKTRAGSVDVQCTSDRSHSRGRIHDRTFRERSANVATS